MSWRFPVRRDSSFKPARPKNSFYRTGYERTAANPRGYHRAVDIPAPRRKVKQAPERCKIVWKGWFGDLGRVIEVVILDGYDKGRYVRMSHCDSYTADPPGTIKARGAALARVGCTGRCSGNHEHEELARYSLRIARDPRWDLTERVQNAWDRNDF